MKAVLYSLDTLKSVVHINGDVPTNISTFKIINAKKFDKVSMQFVFTEINFAKQVMLQLNSCVIIFCV